LNRILLLSRLTWPWLLAIISETDEHHLLAYLLT